MKELSFLDPRNRRTYSIKLITDGYTGLNIENENIIIEPQRILSNSVNITERLGSNFFNLGLSDKSVLEFSFDCTFYLLRYVVKNTEIQVNAEVRDRTTQDIIKQIDMGRYFIDDIKRDRNIASITAYSNKIKNDKLPDVEEEKLAFIQEYLNGTRFGSKEISEFSYYLPINYLDLEVNKNKFTSFASVYTRYYPKYEYPLPDRDKYYVYKAYDYVIYIRCRAIIFKSSTVKEYDSCEDLNIANKLFIVNRRLYDSAWLFIPEIRNHIVDNDPKSIEVLKMFNNYVVDYNGNDCFVEYGKPVYLDIPNISSDYTFEIRVPMHVDVYQDGSQIYDFNLTDLDFLNIGYYETPRQQNMIYSFKDFALDEKESNSRSERSLLNDYFELQGKKITGKMGLIDFSQNSSALFPQIELFPSKTLYPSCGTDKSNVPVGLGMQEEFEIYEESEKYTSIKYVYYENDKKIEVEFPIYKSYDEDNIVGKVYDVSKNEVMLATESSNEEILANYINIIADKLKTINLYYNKVHTIIQGSPFLNPGEYADIYTIDGRIIKTIITELNHSGEQGMVTEIDNRL